MSNPSLQTLTVPEFEQRIQKTANCWHWLGSLDSGGYGQIWLDNTSNKAHRVAYTLYKGVFKDHLLVRHTCDNRVCVNPSHLILGTHKDNSQDAVARGRQTQIFGSANGNAKLTYEARKIAYAQCMLGIPAAHTAKQLGVHKSTISRLYRNIKQGTFMP
jgi:HNH endonuclease